MRLPTGMRPQHHRPEKQVGYVILEVPEGLGSAQGARMLGVSSGYPKAWGELGVHR